MHSVSTWTNLAAALVVAAVAAVAAQQQEGETVAAESEISLRMGGCGGVYLLAPVGELVVECPAVLS